MGFFRGLIFALLPSLVLWAVIGTIAHRTYILLATPPAALLAVADDGHRIN